MESKHHKILIELELKSLKAENDRLHNPIKRLEGFQRRSNIRFFNVAEENNEDLDKKMYGICYKYLPSSCVFNYWSFERIRRIGPNLKGKNRL